MASAKDVDVVIVGAGAAGLMCALVASQRGRKVVVLDHANKVGKKILMSGGGRCNFTNTSVEPNNYISSNPHFCKSALSRYTPWDFIDLVTKHQIPFHEKKAGQLFCDNKANDILQMLLAKCQAQQVEIRTRCEVNEIVPGEKFSLETSIGLISCESVVIATGGLSIPTMGATGFGYSIAEQFGLKVLPVRAGLVPFILDESVLDAFKGLAGSSIEVTVCCNQISFTEAMLFTHKGLSGPAMLQISSYWQEGDELEIDLLPHMDLAEYLQEKQKERPKAELKNILGELLTKNIAQSFCEMWFPSKPINQLGESEIKHLARQFHHWLIVPKTTEGYRTAEVTLGGIDTNELSSKTMESKKQQGLFFIGEVVDVTGWLGGFNFQWAWASGYAAGCYV